MSDSHAEFKIPSISDVEQALVQLGNPHHRRVFFAGLRNPHWLQPLRDLGVFKTELELRQDSIDIGVWSYLIRMSYLEPDLVVAVSYTHLTLPTIYSV